MSNTTNQLRELQRDLQARYDALPDVSKRTGYASHLLRTIESTRQAVQDSEEMDDDKSRHRCH